MSLKIARKIARLTQAQLAQLAGVPASTINRLENGQRRIETMGYAAVVRLAHAVSPGMAVEELFPIDVNWHDRRSA